MRLNLSNNVNAILKKASHKINLSPKHGPKSILSISVMTAKCKYKISLGYSIYFTYLCEQRLTLTVSALGTTSADKVNITALTFTDKEHVQSSLYTEYLFAAQQTSHLLSDPVIT